MMDFERMVKITARKKVSKEYVEKMGIRDPLVDAYIEDVEYLLDCINELSRKVEMLGGDIHE